MSWAPYLLNSFLEDCKDAQDWGSEFHYSWLLILIALMGWQEPTYNLFLPRTGKCGATRYTSLRSTVDPKKKKLNSDMFMIYLTEIQNRVAETWRIPIETVQEFGQIANFQASRHSMWLQAKRDPAKEWLQLKYCVTMQDIQMEVQEWPEEWRVPTIPKTVPGAQTRMQDRTVPVQADRHKWSKHQEKYDTGPRRGQHSHKKENQNEEEIPMWFYTGTIAHREDNKRNNRTSVPGRKGRWRHKKSQWKKEKGRIRQGYTDARSI
jgi:hypothetical protein